VTTPLVLVDARNVVRSRWPNIREDRFLELTRAWAEEEGVRAIAVFDGGAPDAIDGLPVVGTGPESADDWIAQQVAEAPPGERIWLVSSDRGLRARVVHRIERVIGGGAFATSLEALERRG
jgi:hypothetical protein